MLTQLFSGMPHSLYLCYEFLLIFVLSKEFHMENTRQFNTCYLRNQQSDESSFIPYRP